jgi:hypothetical protein
VSFELHRYYSLKILYIPTRNQKLPGSKDYCPFFNHSPIINLTDKLLSI